METQTPLWLGIIIMILGYAVNILLKWVDVEKQKRITGEKFRISFWIQTNKLNIFLSIAIVALLMLLFPDLPDSININGDMDTGRRLMYALIGFAPYRIFKMIIPERFQGIETYEVLKQKTGVK